MKARAILFLALFSLVGGCSRECQIPADTRCDGDVAEICDADGHWEPFSDCREIGPGWVCGEVPFGSTCVPTSELDAAVSEPTVPDGGHP